LPGHGNAKKKQRVLGFANTELFQLFPDLYQGGDLVRVDWWIEPLPIEYSYAQGHEWTISKLDVRIIDFE
jgi:hypothetical protein